MKFKKNFFTNNDDIVDFDITDSTTRKVKEFYEKFPFPNYKLNDNKQTILEQGDKNSFAN